MPVLKTSEEDKRGFRLPMVIPTSELQVSRYIFFKFENLKVILTINVTRIMTISSEA